MKELSVEEKAKAYDKLFVKAQQIYNKENDVLIIHTIEDLFPELKESEDERIRKDIIILVNNWWDRVALDNISTREQMLAWLEKQGEQKPQRIVSAEAKESMYDKPTWSEEDLDSITAAINNLEYLKNNYIYHQMGLEPAIAFLKSLKYRVLPKQEWSEGDATHYNRILKELNLQKEMPINASVIEEIESDIIWLKSLRPNTTWKPSDEQIKALLKLEEMHVLEHEKNQENAHLYMVIKSIREQLLKLREE